MRWAWSKRWRPSAACTRRCWRMRGAPASGTSTSTARRRRAAGAASAASREAAATPALALLRTWEMVGVLFVFAAFMFCGMAMKMLLSAVFEQTLAMTHLQSTYYSAL